MGLSLYVTKPERVASWSYGGFHDFRQRLAHEIGIDLGAMEGFNLNGKPWPEEEDEPLVALLNHSDSEGELNSEQCKVIAPRLREIVKRWPEDDPHREEAERLADGMDEAAEAGGEVLFW